MTREGPSWLAELQARFGAAIRTPLDRSSGTLTATPSAYDARLVELVAGGPSRLAVYNRQYWFRLFELLQSAFPLASHLLGPWTFNGYAAAFLVAQPPRGWDLDRAPDGFDAFLAVALEREGVPNAAALVEAARIDAAWHRVFRAPATAPLRPTPADAPKLLDARLAPSPAVELIEEHWPLTELRRQLLAEPSQARAGLPLPLPDARCWAIVRTDRGTALLPLQAREAQLLWLLRSTTVREALARLEAACAPEERAALPAQAHAWLARSVQLGFWIAAG